MSKNDELIAELMNGSEKMTDRQKNIVVAAVEMFAEKGYSGTSTKEIAQKAGVAEGTIFRHYKTKKDLLLAIVTPTMIKLLAPVIIKDLNKVLNKEFENFEDFIREMVANRAEFLNKNGPTVRVLIQEIPFHPELKEQFIKHIGEEVYARYLQIVKHYQDKGEIIEMEPASVVRFTASVLLGYFAAKHVISPAGWNDELELNNTITMLKAALDPKK
ncbi:TetR/AcrR family transcriptional regulator [Chungangia koreensis]|uniref:TetR/AcrR family transcriptional regulator n=1 Tax=Chungangia koreensis TaxID=752657 RepID=A0ABV8WZK0_9LACT